VSQGNYILNVAFSVPFTYDPGSKLLIINAGSSPNSFAYTQQSSVTGGVLHTLYTFNVNGASVAYSDSQLTQVIVHCLAGGVASLTTSDTYVGSDGLTHETAEEIVLGGSGGTLYRTDASGNTVSFMQLSGFTGIYAYAGHADAGVITGTPGLTNIFVSAGAYAYMDSGPVNLYYIGGARYVYGYAAGTGDYAYHYDGSGASALVISGTAYSFMLGTDNSQSFFNEAVGFQTNYGIARHAAQDSAYFYDSPRNDVFVGNTATSYLYSDDAVGRYNEFDFVQGFALVEAFSFVGGIDYADVYDLHVNTVFGFRLAH
jgi:hypothetical protein